MMPSVVVVVAECALYFVCALVAEEEGMNFYTYSGTSATRGTVLQEREKVRCSWIFTMYRKKRRIICVEREIAYVCLQCVC